MATDATDPKDAVNAAAEMTAARLVTASRQTAQFTDLPVELKERIYSYAIATDGHHIPMNSFRTNTSSSFCYANYSHHHASSANFSHYLPAVCFISRLERITALRTFFRNITVTLLHEYDRIYMWQRLNEYAIERGADDMFAALSKLELNYFDRPGLNGLQSDMEFAQHCTLLRSFTLTMPQLSLSCEAPSTPRSLTWGRVGSRALTGAEIVRDFGLARLVGLKQLRRVIVKIHFYVRQLGNFDNNDGILEAAEWLREEFKKLRGRDSVGIEVWQQGKQGRKICPARLVVKSMRGR
jgi:hypothetical protein